MDSRVRYSFRVVSLTRSGCDVWPCRVNPAYRCSAEAPAAAAWDPDGRREAIKTDQSTPARRVHPGAPVELLGLNETWLKGNRSERSEDQGLGDLIKGLESAR